MIEEIKFAGRALYENSPRHNFRKLCKKWNIPLGGGTANEDPEDRNQVLGGVLGSDPWGDIMIWKLKSLGFSSYTLLGDIGLLEQWSLSSRTKEIKFNFIDWDGETLKKTDLPRGKSPIVICREPVDFESWEAIKDLKEKFGERVLLLTELLLPFTRFSFLLSKLDFYKTKLEENLPFYFGTKYFGPLEALDEKVKFKGKKVIEFGPLDGFQTSGLLHLGVKSLDCIEARAENATKIEALKNVIGWKNLNVIMDDFHNCDEAKYGKYDIAFAHGVYYHSIQPFLFLNNLMSLSDTVFIGGFCATDSLPDDAWMSLSHNGKDYRVKRYTEWNRYSAGINSYGYFFHRDDLIGFFEDNGYGVEVLDETKMEITAGNYLRMIAKKRKGKG